MLAAGVLRRLEAQLDAIPVLLAGAPAGAIDARPESGKWSARENLAHLSRYHAVFLERLRRILGEDRPELGRYRAEDDPAWAEWSKLPLAEILSRMTALRAEIVSLLEGLPEGRTERTGIHPLLGEMAIPRWVEFFLLHEAHHLYVAMLRLGGSPAAIPRGL